MRKILVVDDEWMILDLLQEVLTQAGHRVLTASSGEEALRLFRQERPDLTLLDMILPGMDGVSVLRSLQKLDPTAPVIALTATVSPALESEVRKLGVSDFLRKDLETEVVLESIRRAVEARERVAPSAAIEGPARILVVDDDPAMRELLHEFLAHEGYQVSTASHGEEALERVEAERPHLILLDLEMPGMGGLAVLRRLSRQAPEVGVIVISGMRDRQIIEETMKLGSFDYFAKPVDLERLGVSVRAKLFLMQTHQPTWWRRWLGLATPDDVVALAPERPARPAGRLVDPAVLAPPATEPHSQRAAITFVGSPSEVTESCGGLTAEDVARVEAASRGQIKGQDQAIQAVVDALSLSVIGAGAQSSKPIATFLLAGPTGTGKTTMAKVVADALERALVRFDMPNFASKEGTWSLLGSPRGLIGSTDGGQLTGAVRAHPRAVVLLDEIEKADPAIWQLFLRVFDEGVLVDQSFGTEVDFTRTIIFCTSNLLQTVDPNASDGELRRTLVATCGFRPEFVNRLDRIIVYRSLAPAVVLEIVSQIVVDLLEGFQKRHRLERMPVDVHRSVIDLIMARCDVAFGARELRRQTEMTVGMALAESFLAHGAGWRAADRLQVSVQAGRVWVAAV